MKKLTNLKLTLLQRGITQRAVSERTGINEAIVSMISNGRINPDQSERQKISEAIQVPEKELFQEMRT